MKCAKFRRLSLFLLSGLAVFSLSGCQNKINVALAQNQKIVLNPSYGDQILWHQGIKPTQVHFLLPFCKETDTWITQCTVNVKVQPGQFGQFNYICKGGACVDPEVDVGSSDSGPLGKGEAVRLPPATSSDTVGLPCDSGTIKPTPADLPGDFYGPVVPGTVILWQSQGVQPLAQWTVTFNGGNTTVCVESDIHDENGYQYCTIKQGLGAGTYTYQAASTSCQSGSGTVTLK